MNNNSKRIYYFDCLRIVSAFSTILIHVSAHYFNHYSIKSYFFKISFYYIGISRFGIPNFLMMSGALFLGRDLSFKNVFNKYIKRIFIHLLLWSVFYSLINLKVNKINKYKTIYKIIKGHYHLWYLFKTIGLYMIVPFLREIIKKQNLLEKLVFLYFIILFIIN